MSLLEPLFSVVIPLYNKEAYISSALNSVLHQTIDNFEIIVVDDGSTDSSLKIVQSFTDPRLKIFTKKNGGVSEARNFGITKAHSEYIGLLDADDKWDSDFLEEMKALIEKYPACGLYASAFKRLKPNKTIIIGKNVPEGIIDDFFKVKFLHDAPCASAIVIRKKVFDEVGGFPVGMIGGEDDYTWAKIAGNHGVAFTPKALVLVNATSSSLAWRLGKMDYCKESWFDFYVEGAFYRNEFIAKKAIYAGIRYAYNLHQRKSSEIEKLTQYNILSKKHWRKLYLLNRIPYRGIILWKFMWPYYQKVKYWLLKF